MIISRHSQLNFEADSPGDVIQYIAAHDNLTLFDIIAQSIKKDPSKPENNVEIHRRLRLGNLMVLTAQGTPFIHSGQEYGRTKQFRDPAYRYPVSEDKVPNKSHLLVDERVIHLTILTSFMILMIQVMRLTILTGLRRLIVRPSQKIRKPVPLPKG